MKKSDPFKYFKTSPEIIRLSVMLDIRLPLSLRTVEDLLCERGIDVCRETERFWWQRLGPMFAAEIGKRHGQPEVIVTDRLRSYGSALKELHAAGRQETGRWVNNRAENSHLPFRRRERAMLRFRRMRALQKFAAVHASVTNHFNQEGSFSSRILFRANRAAALAEWRGLCAD